MHLWKGGPSSRCLEPSGRAYGLASRGWAGFQLLPVPSSLCPVQGAFIQLCPVPLLDPAELPRALVLWGLNDGQRRGDAEGKGQAWGWPHLTPNQSFLLQTYQATGTGAAGLPMWLTRPIPPGESDLGEDRPVLGGWGGGRRG